MFTDSRSKNIVFVAHCILNQNNKFDTTADYPGAIPEVMKILSNSNVGIVQLPCPEAMCLGLDRGFNENDEYTLLEANSKIRIFMKKEPAFKKLKELVKYTIDQILEYQKYDFNIKGIIGVNRSPTCGVETTSKDNKEVNEEGVFIKEVKKELNKNGILLNIIGIKAFEPKEAVSKIEKLIFN